MLVSCTKDACFLQAYNHATFPAGTQFLNLTCQQGRGRLQRRMLSLRLSSRRMWPPFTGSCVVVPPPVRHVHQRQWAAQRRMLGRRSQPAACCPAHPTSPVPTHCNGRRDSGAACVGCMVRRRYISHARHPVMQDEVNWWYTHAAADNCCSLLLAGRGR